MKIGISMIGYERMAIVVGDQEVPIDRGDLEKLRTNIDAALRWTQDDFEKSKLRRLQEQEDWHAAGGNIEAYKALRQQRTQVAA